MISRRQFLKGTATTAIAVTISSTVIRCSDDDTAADTGTNPTGGVTVTGSHDANHSHTVGAVTLNGKAQTINVIGHTEPHLAVLTAADVTNLATAGFTVTVKSSFVLSHQHNITFTSS